MSKLLSEYIEESSSKKRMMDTFKKYTKKGSDYLSRKRKEFGDFSKRNAENLAKKTGDSVGDKIINSDNLKKAADEVGKAAKKVQDTASETEKTARTIKNVTIGAGALGASVVALKSIKSARDEYRKRIMGQCARYTGRDATICRINAAKYHQKFLNGQMKNCKKTSNPEKCKELIGNAIQRAKRQEGKLILKIR